MLPTPLAKGGQGGFLGLLLVLSKTYSFGCGYAARFSMWFDGGPGFHLLDCFLAPEEILNLSKAATPPTLTKGENFSVKKSSTL